MVKLPSAFHFCVGYPIFHDSNPNFYRSRSLQTNVFALCLSIFPRFPDLLGGESLYLLIYPPSTKRLGVFIVPCVPQIPDHTTNSISVTWPKLGYDYSSQHFRCRKICVYPKIIQVAYDQWENQRFGHQCFRTPPWNWSSIPVEDEFQYGLDSSGQWP